MSEGHESERAWGGGISLFTRGRVSGGAFNFIIRNDASRCGKWGGDKRGVPSPTD